MDSASIITLVNGREKALQNFITGILLGDEKPDELVIVFMNELPYSLPQTSFPVKTVILNSEEQIPLAKARNLGAKNAQYENLVFLDVDCIPDIGLLALYKNMDEEKLHSGVVRYLSKTATEHIDFERLFEMSLPDAIRSSLDAIPYELFWSLNFACNRKVFNKIGGFNEEFTGYGGEDTDFAFRARDANIQIEKSGATAFHQYHDSYQPPLNHFSAIVKNAKLFHSIWNKWPMEGWLIQFESLGLISWGKEITVIRDPKLQEVEQALKIVS